MNQNMMNIIGTVTTLINEEFKDQLPSLDQINSFANDIRIRFSDKYPISDDEFDRVKKALSDNIIHSIGYSYTLHGRDANHETWYFVHSNDAFYWNRYRTYLLNDKKWSPEIVRRLHETTDKILDDLGDPTKPNKPFQRRGLLLGDVQSGKTATYTAISNKAADAGYKVIIILAGVMENLRVQTQSRLDAEFAGIESRYTLDSNAPNSTRNTPVGVGKIPPFAAEKTIARFTSVTKDFNSSIVRQLGLSLINFKGTALFVVKKNKSVLNNLYNWLMDNNASKEDGLINLSLLLIDDEADNASLNTNSDELNPTAINAAIKSILHSFKQATYLGITATPYANIFVDPSIDDDGVAKDLFPKDFLTVLPTPERYIGADKIFGNGNADEWENEEYYRDNAEYTKALEKIENEEQEKYFKFKHKKELAAELCDLPESLCKAIRYFILVTAISDLRKDNTEHRSMLVNVSRFTVVQNTTADLVEKYIADNKSDIENYAHLDMKQSLNIPRIARFLDTWNEFNLELLSGCTWENMLHDFLFKAIRRIEVRRVNQYNSASSLNYNDPAYRNVGMRVIAVGGNSLSRGLTLEGLCTSYFYRNTMMYDTLLQMGRWFGYRPNYDDLFRIWIGTDAVDWFGYITDAANELKQQLRDMELQNQTPEQFGLKVRQAPGTLLITARNKMRNATPIHIPISVAGRMIETPRLKNTVYTLQENEQLCRRFIQSLEMIPGVTRETDPFVNAIIWRKVPKEKVSLLVRSFDTHPWNLDFQPLAVADYINNETSIPDLWDVAVPIGSGPLCFSLETYTDEVKIALEKRDIQIDESIKNMAKVSGRHVRVGSGGCSKIGLPSTQIIEIQEQAKRTGQKITDSTYLDVDRSPLALIHVLKNTSTQSNDEDVYFALGIGFPGTKSTRTAQFYINPVELRNWVDVTDFEDNDD